VSVYVFCPLLKAHLQGCAEHSGALGQAKEIQAKLAML
jgi:hypothetical protein